MRVRDACAALAALLLGAPVAAVEREGEVGGYHLPAGEIEIGGFNHVVSDGQPDWKGHRTLVRMRPWRSTTGQLELLQAWRGDDSGQLAGLALWQAFGPRLWTFTGLTGSSGADFLPTWRADAELHFATPGFERLQPFLGGGYADYENQDITITTLGTSLYLPLSTLAVLSYRLTDFDNKLGTGTLGRRGDGRLHHVSLLLGPEHGTTGQLDAAYYYGTDLIQDFVTTGTDERLWTHGIRLGWRRRWTEHLGTYVGVDWAHKDGSRRDITFDQLGGDARMVWYFGGPAQASRRAEE